MARRLDNGKYVPGVVYRLCFEMDGEWVPMYVGESYQPSVREAQHRNGGRSDDDRLVYEAIRSMNESGVEWKMVVWCEYGEEGPSDLEDLCVLETLAEGYALTNLKRGNANWLARMEADAKEMKSMGIKSAREYRAKKRELMQAETVMDASAVAKVAEASGRKKANPRLEVLHKRTKKWSRKKILEHVKLLEVTKYKYSYLWFSNEMALFAQILKEKDV